MILRTGKMSQEDDLILNFADLDSSVISKSSSSNGNKAVGGRWKDRRKLQLQLHGRGRKAKRPNTSGPNSIPVSKRVKNQNNDHIESNGDEISTKDEPMKTHKTGGFSEKSGLTGGQNSTFVSSLFTSSDKNSVLVPTEDLDSIKKHIPSNAPLTDATSFSALGINDILSDHLANHLRIKTPTSIQKVVVPNLMSANRDLFIKAQTGSGKTLSFLLPIYNSLMKQKDISRESGLFALILVPTRELALQIYGVMEALGKCVVKLVPGIVIGGEKRKSEKARLRKGINILVATPGRLADHMENTKSFRVDQLRWLILDEGDKLMELGFEETITKITDIITTQSKLSETVAKWDHLPMSRVNVLCSATMENSVQKLGSIVLNDPLLQEAHISSTNSKSLETPLGSSTILQSDMTVPDQLLQHILVVPPKLRLVTLAGLLKNISNNSRTKNTNMRTMIFFSCSDSVDFHFDIFTRGGKVAKKIKNEETGEFEIKYVDKNDGSSENPSTYATGPCIAENTTCFKLHGSLTQPDRLRALQEFVKPKEEGHLVLFCTDVASRGLDLPNISQVVEYDPPFSIEDHMHRIGRSARAGNSGDATLFLLPGIEENYLEDKVRNVHNKKDSIIVNNYVTLLEKSFGQTNGTSVSSKLDPKAKQGKWDIHATTWHLNVERWILENSKVHEKAAQAFTSHIRAYATHLSSERKYFNVKTLHLGHIAKCFGLRETPSKLGKSSEKGSHNNSNKDSSNRGKKEDPKKKMLRLARLAVKSTNDEFNY